MSSKFGWDLPPGVSPRDIPGNGKDDEARESFLDEAYGANPAIIDIDQLDEDTIRAFDEALFWARAKGHAEGYADGRVDGVRLGLGNRQRLLGRLKAHRDSLIRQSIEIEGADSIERAVLVQQATGIALAMSIVEANVPGDDEGVS